MAKITEIYARYKIMPVLQMHQLRVAAVAKTICQNLKVDVDEESVVSACLLHDMANILKFDLSVFPDFVQPEGRGYWEQVKKEYQDKYQTEDEHPATYAIAQELGVSEDVLKCIDAVGFSKGPKNAAAKEYEPKICAYADMRVGPYGVLSLEDRLNEAHLRYIGEHVEGRREDPFANALRTIEKQIFAQAKIEPQDITDKTLAEVIEQLKSYEI